MSKPSTSSIAKELSAFGLRDIDTPLVPGDEDWPALVASLSSQKLTGLAVAAMESGELLLSEQQTEELLERHESAMVWALQIERTLTSIAPHFEETGIELVVIKGPALAHTVYPDPSWRPFADLDLLVRTKDWDKSCEILAGFRWQRDVPEPRKGFDVRFGKAAVFRTDAKVEIDLHRTLVLGPFGLWIDSEELIDRAVPFHLGGVSLLRLDNDALLLHGFVHAALERRTPLTIPVRDVAQILLSLGTDWTQIATWAERWNLAAVVHYALASVYEKLAVSAKAPFDELPSATAKEERVLLSYTTDRRFRGGTALATLHAIGGLRSKAAYLQALLLPGREFLEARGNGHTANYRSRWKIPLRWIRGVRH